jgi:hypothetical protein
MTAKPAYHDRLNVAIVAEIGNAMRMSAAIIVDDCSRPEGDLHRHVCKPEWPGPNRTTKLPLLRGHQPA